YLVFSFCFQGENHPTFVPTDSQSVVTSYNRKYRETLQWSDAVADSRTVAAKKDTAWDVRGNYCMTGAGERDWSRTRASAAELVGCNKRARRQLSGVSCFKRD